MTTTEPTEAAMALRAAWNDLIAGLERARDAVDSPELHAPPPTDRILAEGYRYLLGFLFGAIERGVCDDPDFPYFRRAIQPVDKATIDNADAQYLSTPIDGNRSYLVRGRASDHRHWRGNPPADQGRKAPQYVIFEAHTGYAGDTGELTELLPGGRVNTGKLESTSLEVEPDGTFEILLGPERPAGHTGNFITTRRSDDGVHTAEYLTMRVLFHDWEREDPLDLHIAALDMVGAHPQPLDPQGAATRMRRIAEITENQMRFWNEFYAVLLETHADMNGDGKRFMPRNDLNEPSQADLATGGGQSTNIYSGGVYELAPHEALVIEERMPEEPQYGGFHLSNFWGESYDYANQVTSLNTQQAATDPDGIVRRVIAHHDPGVPNWLDTTGYQEGYMTFRWTYSRPPKELPSVTCKVVAFDDIRSHLPDSTPTVTPAERREQIRVRQEHVQRRYRQY